jgi:hypothetical protein
MPSTNQELVLEVTRRERGGYRLRAFEGFPTDLATAKPVKGLADADFPLAEWLNGDHATIEALKPLLAGRPRVRLCLDPSLWELNRLPFEEIFDRRFGLTLFRHPLTSTGQLAAPYAEEVSVLGKLKVLLVYANPTPGAKDPDHLPHLKEHFDVLVQALGGLVRQQLVVLDRLDNESGELTAQCILERINSFDPHVMVYVGHGYAVSCFDRDGLFWGQRPEQHVPFATLREALNEMGTASGDKSKPALRLMVLIACHSDKAGRHLQSPAFREAEGMRQAQLPAFVGMHHEFPVAATAAFGELLLGGVSRRQSIEGAFAAALRALRTAPDPALKQAGVLPRLWLTAHHSRLFPPPEECARGIYLEKVKGAFSHVPFSNRVTTVPLHDLYVRPVVVERKDNGQQRISGSALAPGDTISHLEQQVTDQAEKVVAVSTALKMHHRVLLIAEARTGKSTLCQNVIAECDRNTPWLPVLLRFSVLSRTGVSLQDFLKKHYAPLLGLTNVKVLTGIGASAAEVPFPTWLYQQWEAGNVLLMVDGLDEEFDEERSRAALDRLTPLSSERAKQPFVLFTARPNAALLVHDAHALTLKVFDTDAQIRQCARNCETILARLERRKREKRQVEAFLQSLSADQRCNALARRPGHLVEMYVQFRTTGNTALFEQDLMTWVSQERFKTSGRAEAKFSPSSDLRRQVMNDVCFHLLCCQRRSWAYSGEMRKLVATALFPPGRRLSAIKTDRTVSQMLGDLVRNAGFLREVRIEGRDAYEVEGVLFLQYFAAAHIAQRLEQKNQSVSSWILGDAEWHCEVCEKQLQRFCYWTSAGYNESPLPGALQLLGTALTGGLTINASANLEKKLRRSSDPRLCHWRSVGDCEVAQILLGIARTADLESAVIAKLEMNLRRSSEVLRRKFGRPDPQGLWGFLPPAVQRRVERRNFWLDQFLQALCRARQAHREFAAVLKRMVLDEYSVWLPSFEKYYFRGTDGFREMYFDILLRSLVKTKGIPDQLWERAYYTRFHAMALLGRIGDRRTIEPLVYVLENDATDNRARAAHALGQFNEEYVIKKLINSLGHSHLAVVCAAASALGRIGTVSAIGPLCAVLRDKWNAGGYQIQETAEEALDLIARKNHLRIWRYGCQEPAPPDEEGKVVDRRR